MFTSKMTRSVVFAALFATLPMTATTSFAAEEGGVKVGGNLTQQTYAYRAYNSAYGEGAKAGLSVGAIHGKVDVGGNLYQRTTSYYATNYANGKNSTACSSIGSIGDNKACE